MNDYCTWENCDCVATTPQIAKDGRQWANLCDAHAAQLSSAIAKSTPAMLAAWVKAQGGAKAAAESFR